MVKQEQISVHAAVAIIPGVVIVVVAAVASNQPTDRF